LASGQKIESGWEKVESREAQDWRGIGSRTNHLSNSVDYFLPSTRSTFYLLLSSLFVFLPKHPANSPLKRTAVTFAFEKLLVYQKFVDFADAVCTATEQFQRGYGFLVDQLNRAALSISFNIA